MTADSTPAERIQVVRYDCPFTEQVQYALWDVEDNVPLVAANNYLRTFTHLEEATRKAKAYNLLPWFRFLARNELAFWPAHVRATGPVTRLFRNSLHLLRTSGAVSDTTAQKYMEETFQLCRFWKQTGEADLGHIEVRRSRGFLSHTSQAVVRTPAEWTLRPRRGRAPSQEEKALGVKAIEAMWSFLAEDCRPKRPAVLRTRPQPTWSDAKRRAYERARSSFDYRWSLYRRNLAIWGVMLAAGVRLGELPLLTTDDVRTDQADVYRVHLCFVLRDETQHLGSLKGAQRSVYIGFDRRTVDALRDWQMQRGTALARGQAKGHAPHLSLFTNDDGTPLTRGAVIALFRKLRTEVERLTRESDLPAGAPAVTTGGARRRRVRTALYPHLLRHTIETIMRSNGVPLDVQQRHLGHIDPRSTMQYGTVYDTTYQEALRHMKESFDVLRGDA